MLSVSLHRIFMQSISTYITYIYALLCNAHAGICVLYCDITVSLHQGRKKQLKRRWKLMRKTQKKLKR